MFLIFKFSFLYLTKKYDLLLFENVLLNLKKIEEEEGQALGNSMRFDETVTEEYQY